jgi:hypothetical protein
MSIVPLSVLAAGAVRHCFPRRRSERDSPWPTRGGRCFDRASPLDRPVRGFSGLFYVETERIWIFLTPSSPSPRVTN